MQYHNLLKYTKYANLYLKRFYQELQLIKLLILNCKYHFYTFPSYLVMVFSYLIFLIMYLGNIDFFNII